MKNEKPLGKKLILLTLLGQRIVSTFHLHEVPASDTLSELSFPGHD